MDRFGIGDKNLCNILVEQILKIESTEVDIAVQVNRILESSIGGKDLLTANNQIKNLITECGYASEGKSYYNYMRLVFNQIIIHNICKSNRIQRNEYNVSEMNLKSCFEALDFERILSLQNERSRDQENGMIWVLNTFVLFIPEYKFSLIE